MLHSPAAARALPFPFLFSHFPHPQNSVTHFVIPFCSTPSSCYPVTSLTRLLPPTAIHSRHPFFLQQTRPHGPGFMAEEKRGKVPQFGNWDSEDVPYSAYFDNARRDKKTGQIRQVDTHDIVDAQLKSWKASEEKRLKHEQISSQEQNELKRSIGSPNVMGHKPAIDLSPKWHNLTQFSSDKSEPEVVRPRHERCQSREEGDMRRLTDSPLRTETAHLRNSSNSPHHRHGSSTAGDTPRKATRPSMSSDHSIDHSPMHPHYQARIGGKSSGISSPSWERKAAPDGIHGLAPSTPGRSRLRSVTRGDDSPERGPAIPKFGDWDETNPATADEYSQIFNRVREEKNSETGKAPGLATETAYTNGQKQHGNDNPKGCSCFPWGRG